MPLGPYKWRLPRVVATSMVFVITFSAAGVIVWLALAALLPAIDQGLATYPEHTSALRNYLEPFRSGDLAGGASKLAVDVAKQATTAGSGAEPTGQSAPVNVAAFALGLFGRLPSARVGTGIHVLLASRRRTLRALAAAAPTT